MGLEAVIAGDSALQLFRRINDLEPEFEILAEIVQPLLRDALAARFELVWQESTQKP